MAVNEVYLFDISRDDSLTWGAPRDIPAERRLHGSIMFVLQVHIYMYLDLNTCSSGFSWPGQRDTWPTLTREPLNLFESLDFEDALSSSGWCTHVHVVTCILDITILIDPAELRTCQALQIPIPKDQAYYHPTWA